MDNLSNAIILKIMCYLDVSDLITLQRISRKWYTLARSDCIWGPLIQRDFGNIPTTRSLYLTYKNQYLTIPHIHLIIPLKGLRSQKAIQLFKYLEKLNIQPRPLDYGTDLRMYIQCDSYAREVQRIGTYMKDSSVISYLNPEDIRMIERIRRESKRSVYSNLFRNLI